MRAIFVLVNDFARTVAGPFGDRVAEFRRRAGAMQVGGQRRLPRPLCQDVLDGTEQVLRRVGVAEVLQHHRAAPYLADRVGDTFAGDVRSGAVYGFEQARVAALGVDVRAWGDAGLRGEATLPGPAAWPTAPDQPDADLSDLPTDSAQAARVLEIAAAGGHHLLMIGPAGTAGRLAQRLPGLLPDLDPAAAQVAAVHRHAGTLPTHAPVRRRPPWQAVHHTISVPDMAGTPRRPGAAGLAHAGVLWRPDADRMPGRTRDILRLLLDQRQITNHGAGQQATYPARGAAATGPQLKAALARVPARWFSPLQHRIDAGSLSARSATKVLRMAFTIADLAGRGTPTAEDLNEAIWLRTGQHPTT